MMCQVCWTVEWICGIAGTFQAKNLSVPIVQYCTHSQTHVQSFDLIRLQVKLRIFHQYLLQMKRYIFFHHCYPILIISKQILAQLAGAVEYADCISVEGQDQTPMSVHLYLLQLKRYIFFHHCYPILIISKQILAQSAGASEYTDCIFAEWQDPTPSQATSVLDLTLNNLMVRLQQC